MSRRSDSDAYAQRASDYFGKAKLVEVSRSWTTSSQWDKLNQHASSGEGEQERITLDPLVMPEIFQYLSPTNQKNGLVAFIKSYDEAYQRTIPGDELFGVDTINEKRNGRLNKKDPNQQEHDPVPPSAQTLLSWEEEDLERLGLSDIPELLETLYKTPEERAKEKERERQEKLRFEREARAEEPSLEEQFEAFKKFQAEKKKPRASRKKNREDGRENVQ